jgi:hypothetical protein
LTTDRGIVLKKRWRIPLGLICIVMGLGMVQEGYQLATAGLSTPPKLMEVLGLYRKRSGAMSFEHEAKSECRSVFDRAT